MNPVFETILDEATARLSGDPELRLEVRRELFTHLLSAQAELTDAGEADPVAAATASLGEPDALAEQLWRAHRRRITRRRITRAAAMLCSWPIALSMLSLMVVLLLRSAAPLAMFAQGATNAQNHDWWPLAQAVHATEFSPASGLANDGDAVLQLGRPFDMEQDSDAVMRSARAAAEAMPSDRAVYANYVCLEAWRNNLVSSASQEQTPTFSREALARLLPILEKGRSLDPDNALYPMWIAQALARASSIQVRNQPKDYFPYQERQLVQRRVVPQTCWKVKVIDADLFNQAMQMFHEAALKRRLDGYTEELQQRRLALLPAAEDIRSMVLRMNTMYHSEAWQIYGFDLQVTMAAHALDLAVAGETRQADALAADVSRFEATTVRACNTTMGSIFPIVESHIMNAHAVAVLRATGRTAEADQLAKAVDAQAVAAVDAFAPIFNERPHGELDNGGLLSDRLQLILGHASSGTPLLRQAEYTLFDRTALAWLVASLLGAALLASLTAGLGYFGGGGRAALLLVPSAGELARLTFIALVVPIALYAIFISTTTFGSRSVAYYARDEMIFFEYLIVGLTILTLAVLAARRTVAARVNRLLLAQPNPFDALAMRAAWRCVVRPALLLVITLWLLGTIEGRLGEWRGLDVAGVTAICLIMAWTVFDMMRALRTAAPSNEAAWWRRPFRMAAVILLTVGLTLVGWFGWTGGWGFGLACALLLMLACGVAVVAISAAATSRELSAQRGVRVIGTMLRSVSLRLVWLATMAALVGGAALRWTESRAIRHADQLASSELGSTIEQNPKVAAARDLTLEQLRQQAAMFDSFVSNSDGRR